MNEKDYFKKYPDLPGEIYKLKKEMGDFLKNISPQRETLYNFFCILPNS